VDTRLKKKPTKLIDPLKISPKFVDIISPLLVDLALPSSLLIIQKSLVKINNSLVQTPKNKTKILLSFDSIIKQLLLY
jgi:hypothetical protein